MPCRCGGADACPACGGRGHTLLTGCPHAVVPPEAFEAFAAADLARRGSWPVAGGWLDQAEPCVDAVRFCWQVDAAARAKLNLPPEP